MIANAEIIGVGTELLLGQIANTNAQWLSKQLAQNGINTYYHTVVGDNLKRVKEVFQSAEKRANIIIVTGGLGPTDDDLTREAYQEIYQDSLSYDKRSLSKIEKYFSDNNLQMTDNNKRQARVFYQALVIENKVGMAPGMIIKKEKATWVFLPGVPREMKQMTLDDVIPYLKKHYQTESLYSETLNFIGIGESHLEEEIIDLIKAQSNPTIAPLATNRGVTIRLTAKADSKAKATKLLIQTKDDILSRVGQYYYGSNNLTIEAKLVELLKENKLTLASAESLTGGKFASNLVSVSGASRILKGAVVSYSEDVKVNTLSIPKEVIERGTVTKETAEWMANQVSYLLEADLGISFTGVAGPNEIEGKEVGTVYLSLSKKGKTIVSKGHVFQGDRDMIRNRAIFSAYELLFTYLKENYS